MTGRPSISIIVVNYNGRAFLERCLQAARAQTFADFDVLVVDNGSTDGSREQAKVSAIRCASCGCPRTGVRGSQQRRCACRRGRLSPRTTTLSPEPGWLTALAQAAATSAEIGLVASQMVFDARPEMINSTGVCIHRAGVVWDRAGGALADATGPIIPVFGPSAGAALYRRATSGNCSAGCAKITSCISRTSIWPFKRAGAACSRFWRRPPSCAIDTRRRSARRCLRRSLPSP